MEHLDLDGLEKLANAATPGDWFLHDFTAPEVNPHPLPADVTVSCDHPASITVAHMGAALTGTLDEARANARHISAFNPQTAQALITELREARATIAGLDETCHAHETAYLIAESQTDQAEAERDSLSARLAVVMEALKRISLVLPGDKTDTTTTATGRLNAVIDIARVALTVPQSAGMVDKAPSKDREIFNFDGSPRYYPADAVAQTRTPGTVEVCSQCKSSMEWLVSANYQHGCPLDNCPIRSTPRLRRRRPMADRLSGQTSMSRYKQGTEYDPDKVPSGDAVKRAQRNAGCDVTGHTCLAPHNCSCTTEVSQDGFGN